MNLNICLGYRNLTTKTTLYLAIETALLKTTKTTIVLQEVVFFEIMHYFSYCTINLHILEAKWQNLTPLFLFIFAAAKSVFIVICVCVALKQV